MILKSIKLLNFRQFLNEKIEFARGENGKNVTFIMGDTGSGKTTFAQAFFWCMYGETSFSDKIVLNNIVEKKMTPSDSAEVEVDLCLDHGEVEYTLLRKQIYKKDHKNKVTGTNTTFDIQIKDKSGNTSWVKKTQLEGEVNGILPKELSRYFFFDGERIEKMSKDIASGKKSSDFSEAVRGLLGLNGMRSALDHMNPRKKACVIGDYEASFDARGDTKYQEYTDAIEAYNNEIDDKEDQLEELKNSKTQAKIRKGDKEQEIKQFEDGAKLQGEAERLNHQIESTQNMKSHIYKEICDDFNAQMKYFFSASIIKEALDILKDKDFNGIDIPYMNEDTIQYLLERGTCICGTHLDEGTYAYDSVKKLIDVLPPKSISTMIGQFKQQAKARTDLDKDLLGKIKDNLSTISEQEDDIINYSDELQAIEKKLDGKDVSKRVNAINNEIHQCDALIDSADTKIEKISGEIGSLKTNRDRVDSEREKLELRGENNKRIARYLAYARAIYDEIDKEYSKSESEVRAKLQDTINAIFNEIYEGGLSLEIDEQYHIRVTVEDYVGEVETSTAQSISVIFAFITGIIKMARDNRNSKNETAKLLSSEPYPLVMDAPLSAFDKRRIKTVCNALPEIAEQVIIFIKDTDGELAEKYMGDCIGCRHQFKKINEFETKLI